MLLIDDFDEQHAKIAALKAAEAELTDGPDAALQVLGTPGDPIRMRATLGILFRADRYDAAADLVRDQRPHEKWIDLAVAVFALLGDIPRARSLVEQADASFDISVVRCARLGFAEGVIQAWRKQRPDDSLLGPNAWPDDDTDLAKTVIELLDPLLASVRANRKITGEYELTAVTSAIYCALIARDREFLSSYVHWLVSYVPIPLIVAELCLRGLTEASPAALPNRLRLEHTNDFQAALLAAVVERDLLDKPGAAFDALVGLSLHASREDEKEAVCIALFETCGRCGPDQVGKAIEVVTRLRPNGSRFLGLLRAIKHLADGNITQAKEQIDAVRDESDGVWWQAQAQICERSGDESEAEHAWEKASELVPHPDVVRRSIKASIDRRRYQSAIRGLTKLLEQDPDNEQHLKTLAWAQTQLGDHVQAAIHLKRLVELRPSDAAYRTWFAHALARTAQTAEAIDVLRPLCDADDAPVEATLLFSELLAAASKPEDAFRVLEAISPDYWDDPRFLFSYMQRGHGAGQDRLANEAFARILELRRQGKIAPELLQEGTLEQLLEYGKGFRSRREALQEALIAGRMPWLFAEDALGNPPAWAWTLHTQQLKWLSEEPLTRAAFSIYATNGFTVQTTPQGKRLNQITAPPRGAQVVADLSALLTLHKLGLIHRAAEYFECILLPASYGPLQVRDAGRFAQHQPSREQELQTIRKCVDDHRIRVDSESPQGLIELDEYSDNNETHAYRLHDILALLRSTQRATQAAITELSDVAHKPSAADETHPGLQLGDIVLVRLMTLRTLAGLEVFDQVLDALSICIHAKEYEELHSELRAFEAARAAREFHDTLWHTVADLVEAERIIWKPMPVSDEPAEETNSEVNHVYLDAIRLAQHLKVPLLADDRVLQVIFYVDAGGAQMRAFGTDCLVQTMQNCGAYSASVAARDIRKLMNWRYRFIVPSTDILLVWAEESAENLPGPALLDAAFYLHDSLRDPGLHCGPEESDPPIPMAVKYVVAWMTFTVSFLAKIWGNLRYSQDACIALTRWAGEELIASCPRGLWYHPSGNSITKGERHSVFSTAMIQFTAVRDPGRANQALRTLADSLGMSDDDYLAAAADAIHVATDTKSSVATEREEEKALNRIMMQNALFHLTDGRLDALAFSRFRSLGLLEAVCTPPLPEGLAGILHEASQLSGGHAARGPLVFVRENHGASVIEVDSVLLHPSGDLRRAALSYMLATRDSPEPWLTPHTLIALERASADIASNDENLWRGAAIDVTAIVRQDVLALQASLRQSISSNYQEGTRDYLESVIHPSFQALGQFRPPVWLPSRQRQEIESWILDLSKLSSLDDALTGYLQRCGYLPLSHELSAAKLVIVWSAAHANDMRSWAALWSWALRQGTPAARYHAITIGLHVPEMRPVNEWDQFWGEVINIFDPRDVAEHSDSPGGMWQLSCELASHFARHLEALHPAQHGESVACYAWWLAMRTGEILGHSDKSAEWSLRQIMMPQRHFSQFRSTITRSPVTPSPIRNATLNVRSLWAVSLLTNLASAARSLPQPAPIPQALQEMIALALNGYLLTSPLAQASSAASANFALEDNNALEELCTIEGYVADELRGPLANLLRFRKHLSSPDQLESYLQRFTELPSDVQQVIALAVKDMVSSATTYDGAVAKWLERTNDVVDLLKAAPETVVDPILEALAEFQQHQVASWSIRLPHLLTYAIEDLDDPARIQLLATHVLQMSLNAGTGSAVQRLASANRWSDWAGAMQRWRGNLQYLAGHSEPWVGARVRSISATVSHLVGPNRSHSIGEKRAETDLSERDEDAGKRPETND